MVLLIEPIMFLLFLESVLGSLGQSCSSEERKKKSSCISTVALVYRPTEQPTSRNMESSPMHKLWSNWLGKNKTSYHAADIGCKVTGKFLR